MHGNLVVPIGENGLIEATARYRITVPQSLRRSSTMKLIAHIPGLVAALVAFVALKLAEVALATGGQLVVYLATYAIVTLAVDAALRSYGRDEGG